MVGIPDRQLYYVRIKTCVPGSTNNRFGRAQDIFSSSGTKDGLLVLTAINLHLPQQADIDDMAGGLPDWRSYLAKLPLADPLLAARRIISSLHDANRLPCDALSRYEFLESHRAVIKDLSIALKNFYGSAAFPLTEAEYDKATIVRQMLVELADGYKLVVHALAEIEQAPKAPHEILLTVCFRALHYLSRVILESYTAYQTVPRGIWSDLHTLYAYALAHGISQRRLLNDEDDHNEVLSIQHCYIQIVLVALANPHHLMQGETEKIYRFLNELVGLCRIVPLTQAVPLSGKLIIDPNSDNPPYFALPATTNRLPQQVWLLDNARLLGALTEIMRKRAQGHTTGKAQLSFMERLEVGMFQRLERALGLRSASFHDGCVGKRSDRFVPDC